MALRRPRWILPLVGLALGSEMRLLMAAAVLRIATSFVAPTYPGLTARVLSVRTARIGSSREGEGSPLLRRLKCCGGKHRTERSVLENLVCQWHGDTARSTARSLALSLAACWLGFAGTPLGAAGASWELNPEPVLASEPVMLPSRLLQTTPSRNIGRSGLKTDPLPIPFELQVALERAVWTSAESIATGIGMKEPV